MRAGGLRLLSDALQIVWICKSKIMPRFLKFPLWRSLAAAGGGHRGACASRPGVRRAIGSPQPCAMLLMHTGLLASDAQVKPGRSTGAGHVCLDNVLTACRVCRTACYSVRSCHNRRESSGLARIRGYHHRKNGVPHGTESARHQCCVSSESPDFSWGSTSTRLAPLRCDESTYKLRVHSTGSPAMSSGA